MIDDFKPVNRPAKSLRSKLDSLSSSASPANTNTETFKTPEQVAAEPFVQSSPQYSETFQPSLEPPVLKKKRFNVPTTKKGWLFLSIILVLLLALIGGLVWWFVVHNKPAKTVAVTKKVVVVKKQAPTPVTVPSTLTGLPVNPSVNQQPVTGVMIENSTYARPQSGLSQAGVVFEAIAEGGITRFLALFQDTAPDNVGPIRSVRPYYAQWIMGFDGSLAHVGGSPEALANIRTWGVRDLDQFANGSSYHRVSTREAPHNVYTGIPTLNQLEAKKGYSISTYTGFSRKKASPVKVPTAKTINLVVSGPDYNVVYAYDPATNSYKRTLGGAPHMDANTNTQLSPTVVVAMVIPYSIASDGYHSNYATIGTGPVYVFQDGTVTTGTWTKSANASQITFADSSGNEIKLNPGQTWLTAVKVSSNVTYTP